MSLCKVDRQLQWNPAAASAAATAVESSLLGLGRVLQADLGGGVGSAHSRLRGCTGRAGRTHPKFDPEFDHNDMKSGQLSGAPMLLSSGFWPEP